MRLSGKTVLVTGAARGIGRAGALACAQAGADLVLLDIGADLPGCPYPLGNLSQLDATAASCRAHGASVLTQLADIRDSAALAEVVDGALDRYGRIDALVNNAGIAAPSGKAVHEISDDEWQLMLDIDLTGSWRVMRAVLPAMLAERAGSIVNIASTAGSVGYRYFSAYTAAKHGLVGLTRAAALDYGPHGIRVNAVCPGSVRDEPRWEGRMLVEIARSLRVPDDQYEQAFTESQPMNRLIEAEDVAGAVVWLASDEARQVTGAAITVDGGYTAR
jgi:NAD(P)-dependent dehydrogenase (short-subunit alcohol dehydrogenase family)